MLIPKNVLPISKAVSKDSTRLPTQGIKISRHNGKSRVEATDGSQLIRIDYVTPPDIDYPEVGENHDEVIDFSAIVPSAAWEEAGKTIPKSHLPVLEHMFLPENCNGKLKLITTDLEKTRKLEVKALEGKFPDTEQFFFTPDIVTENDLRGSKVRNHPCAQVCFDADLLGKLLVTLVKIKNSDCNPTVIFNIPLDETKPMLIAAVGANDEEIKAIIMPCRRM